MIRILYPDAVFEDQPDIERSLAGSDVQIEVYRAGSTDSVPSESWASADAIMVSGMHFGENQLQRAPQCRIVIRTGVGYDMLDLDACSQRKIPVCNVPDFGTTDVADHAIAMMLTLARGVSCYNEYLRHNFGNGWRYDICPTVRRLRGEVFGVVGFGAIGIAAALRAKALGMSVVFFDPYAAAGQDLALDVVRAYTLGSLLTAADVISIHAPLTKDTRGMINAAAIGLMRQGSILINTARGPIVDTHAVLQGVKSGPLSGVGLDVLPTEPANLSDPLVAAWHANEPWIRGRVLLSPHAAFYSPASFIDQRRKSIETAMRYLREGVLINCLNASHFQT